MSFRDKAEIAQKGKRENSMNSKGWPERFNGLNVSMASQCIALHSLGVHKIETKTELRARGLQAAKGHAENTMRDFWQQEGLA